jgi:hypothetical protein
MLQQYLEMTFGQYPDFFQKWNILLKWFLHQGEEDYRIFLKDRLKEFFLAAKVIVDEGLVASHFPGYIGCRGKGVPSFHEQPFRRLYDGLFHPRISHIVVPPI